MRTRKAETISFKADQTLAATLREIPNRSEFIRNAIMTALENGCPLCQGTGILTPEQQQHWARFATSHSLERCGRCQAVHLVCPASADQTHSP